MECVATPTPQAACLVAPALAPGLECLATPQAACLAPLLAPGLECLATPEEACLAPLATPGGVLHPSGDISHTQVDS